MRFVGIIPSRYASTRFEGKPLAMVQGKPMIQRVYEQTQKVFAHACFVATDDVRIANAVADFGGQYVMTSAAHQSGTDRCAEAVQMIEKQMQQTFDVVVNVQGDEPFIVPQQLQQIKDCFDNAEVQIATLVKPFAGDEDIFSVNTPKVVMDNAGNVLYFSRSSIPFVRNAPQREWASAHAFFKHIGLYAYRTNVLQKISALPQSSLELAESLEQLRWLQNGYRIRAAITHYPSHAIDTPADLERLNSMQFEG
ncbi:3-deoxy-manno-octulosonate cytidylyltransferase [Bacteroidia bacterium]|nr:3-deoxy-manno-octulosonate cytidylyltransferase [Bacteroidia bacterium]